MEEESNKFEKNLAKVIGWLCKLKFFESFFSWMVRSQKNHQKFVVWFNAFNLSLYLTAAYSPWIFLVWTIVVPTLLFRSTPVSALSSIITMIRDRKTSISIYIITVFFMMIHYICIFSCMYMAVGSVADCKGNEIVGIWEHFYFSVVTFTTLGYGNMVPANTAAEVIASFEALVGFALFAFLIGVASAVALDRSQVQE